MNQKQSETQIQTGGGSRNLYVDQFHENGYVIVEDVYPIAFIESLRKRFLEEMELKVRRFNIPPAKAEARENREVKIDFRPEGGNHDLNRWNMHLPTRPEFLDERLVAHPLILKIIKALLGPQPIAFIIASDTPFPGSGFQNIHQDFPRFGITVNIPLVDFTELNAPIEVWPTSHLSGSKFHNRAVNHSAEELKEIVARVKGKRLLLRQGSVLIRDQRLVHRGTANNSQDARPCLSIWYKNLDHWNLTGLTIQVPHRTVSDFMAKQALKMREMGRGFGGPIRSKKLLLLGNFFGRVVEEVSGSDRDFRRRIPKEMWAGYSEEMRSLLRYASVENLTGGRRSIIGSFILAFAGIALIVHAFLLYLFLTKSRR